MELQEHNIDQDQDKGVEECNMCAKWSVYKNGLCKECYEAIETIIKATERKEGSSNG